MNASPEAAPVQGSMSTMRVLRGLTFERLACGCIGGVYETYAGDIVTILDVRSFECRDDAHGTGALVRRASTAWRERDKNVRRSA